MSKVKKLFGKLLCKAGFHNAKPTSLSTWRDKGINFQCTRCYKGWEKYNDIKRDR